MDTEYFAPASLPEDSSSTCDNGFPRVVFVGVMNYPPNVEAVRWFTHHVWTSLLEKFPNARFDIVGKHPTKAIEELSQRTNIRVTGSVPDVRPFVHDADIVIAPLQIARGIQNKVLEAMSMARPIIASPAAATGIDANDGEHLMIAESPDQWFEKFDQLCRDRKLRNQVASQARELICKEYTWQNMLRGMDRLLDKYLARPSRA